jgi:hypothetical protein
MPTTLQEPIPFAIEMECELSVGVRRGAAGQDGVAYFWSLSAGLTLMNSLSQL